MTLDRELTTMHACRRCDEEIDRDADACPECGYDPGGIARDVAAVVLAGSVILLIAMPPAGVFAIFLGLMLFGFSVLASPARRVI